MVDLFVIFGFLSFFFLRHKYAFVVPKFFLWSNDYKNLDKATNLKNYVWFDKNNIDQGNEGIMDKSPFSTDELNSPLLAILITLKSIIFIPFYFYLRCFFLLITK